MSLSVLTIVKNRSGHLAQLIEGLRRSAESPEELVIVDMGSEPAVVPPPAPFPIHVVPLDAKGLPLAAARNAAAGVAIGEQLLFLDVDCIPMRDLVGEVHRALRHHDALLCAQAFYLGAGEARDRWTEEDLILSAAQHPVRSFPAHGIREETNPGLFWSLVFGIRRARFAQIGGFDEAFTGYGAEDTDFGFRTQRAGIPILYMGGAGAFHQHHDVFDPPLQHLQDIVRNARVFFDRWGFWPMEGWLAEFSRIGLIQWSATEIVIVRVPNRLELERARG